ncbi:MAG: hypothetical protein J0M09_12805 [Xanthomonadales bacterium]|nr:hypothetical protein [Xanthomonadales bacterium]
MDRLRKTSLLALLALTFPLLPAHASWGNSAGGGYYGSPEAACKAMLEPGTFYIFSHAKVKPGDPKTYHCFEKAKDGSGSPIYYGLANYSDEPTTENLKKGNLGERLATDCLAADGHDIIFFKPQIEGTNQGGIDIVTLKNHTVYFIDNKALTKSGNVSSVSALTTNFEKNKEAFLSIWSDHAQNFSLPQHERMLYVELLGQTNTGHFHRVVTNASAAPDDKITRDVTNKLASQGIKFMNVHKKNGCAGW